MRSWRKALGVLAGGLAGLGTLLSSAHAQFAPPPGGMTGPPPGMGTYPGMGMSPAMGMPTGMGMRPPMGMPTSMGAPPGADMGIGPGVFGGCTPMGVPADFPNPAQKSPEPVSPFTMTDYGAPNAFNSEGYPQQPLRWQLSLGYAIVWYRPPTFPPLATTGSLLDAVPGAIGQPNTSIISGGDRPPGASSAFYVRSMYWLKDPEALGLEGSFFAMEQRSLLNSFVSDANGNPLLVRPFFDAGLNAENVDVRANPALKAGTLSDSVRTRMMGAEMNLKWYSTRNLQGASFGLFGGVRWFSLEERYLSNDTSTDIGGGGTSTSLSDNFTTYNQYYGPQVGLEYQYALDRFYLGIVGKVAYGPNYQTIKISGETVQTDLTTGAINTVPQGLFAQPSNVGTYRNTKYVTMPEVDVKMAFELCDHVRLNVGYSGFLISAVRPGEQMDRNINIQPLVVGGGIPPPAPPPPTFRTTTFYANFVNFGIEFVF